MVKKLLKPHTHQSTLEEIFNAGSHFLGILLGVVALIILVTQATEEDNTLKIVSSIIYTISLILMYTASTLYHAIPYMTAKKFFKIVDHASIFILIAGSYTPFTLVTLHGPWGWSLFGVVWGIAIIGLIFKFFFTGKYERLSLITYVVMGWLAVVAAKPLIDNLQLAGLLWLVGGGLSYTFGVIFYILDGKYYFSHAMWHIMVLLGSFCHFCAIFFYVIQ